MLHPIKITQVEWDVFIWRLKNPALGSALPLTVQCTQSYVLYIPKHVGQHCPGEGAWGRAQDTAGHATGEQDTEPR